LGKQSFGCNFDRRKEPFEFLKHVDDVSKSCPVHYILHHYLKTVFRNYYGGDRKHLAFENKGSKEFKATERFLKKRERNEANAEIQSLKAINKGLHDELKIGEIIKKKIGAQEEEKCNVKQIREFQKHIKKCCASARKAISTTCRLASKKKSIYIPPRVEMEVPEDFDLSERFDVWHKEFTASRKYSFLFGSLEAGDCDVAKTIGDWKIRFSGECESHLSFKVEHALCAHYNCVAAW
jgi:hypothetical protein